MHLEISRQAGIKAAVLGVCGGSLSHRKMPKLGLVS